MSGYKRFCTQCGQSASRLARFCERCGHPFRSTSSDVAGETVLRNDSSVTRVGMAPAAAVVAVGHADMDPVSALQSPGPTAVSPLVSQAATELASPAEPEIVSDSLEGFSNRLVTQCTRCKYRGVMGWNEKELPSRAKALAMATIPFGIVISFALFGISALGGFAGFIPAIVLRLIFERYNAQCPSCKGWIAIKKGNATDVAKLATA